MQALVRSELEEMCDRSIAEFDEEFGWRRIDQISAGDENLVHVWMAGLESASCVAPEPRA